MIREIVGARTMASIFVPKKRRKKKMLMPSMSTMGMLAGAGIAYMAVRKNKKNIEEHDEE